ncbi:MAG: integration host factor subunit beta [Planctomycetaceae bacterium]|jgi:nucleoid DNA-binding protein|nr:integration host factor subunit beta [Planctomycetaceae bacterium]
MTKKEITQYIAASFGLPHRQAKEIVQKTFDTVIKVITKTGRIELRNFGVFEVKARKARKARNPKTGESVKVPPKYVVTFKPGKLLEVQAAKGARSRKRKEKKS